jgi:uncharacterized protein (DUF2062 family)
LSSARTLWTRALNERASPREIGLAFGLGVWIGCSPFVGLHLGLAAAAATLLRLNRLWAMAGSRVAVAPVLATVALVEIELGHRVITGTWTALDVHTVLSRARELFLDWSLGALLFGAPVATAAGWLAFELARRRARAVIGRTPDGGRPPSSGSPPSAPPAPSS